MPSRPVNSDNPRARGIFRLGASILGLVLLIPALSSLPALFQPKRFEFLSALNLLWAPLFFLWIGVTGHLFPQWRCRPVHIPDDEHAKPR